MKKQHKCPNCIDIDLKTRMTKEGRIENHCDKCDFRIPENHLRVDEVFAFVSLDQDDNEGIPALKLPDGSLMPMISADAERVESLKPYAKQLMKQTGMNIKLLKFTNREEVKGWYFE